MYFKFDLFLIYLCASFLTLKTILSTPTRKTKRQLYREQLTPRLGGKIPDSAFDADRLALNRLNKEGITVPDGVLFEQRHRESHYQYHRNDPDIAKNVIRLVQTPDGRYTPTEGRYPSFENEIESTYVVRPPTSDHSSRLPPYRPTLTSSLHIPTKTHFPKTYKDENVFINRLQHNSVYHDYEDWSSWDSSFPEFVFSDIHTKDNFISDYPSLTKIPLTTFSCDSSGKMYPDPQTKCQVFHLCHFNGLKETFLCPAGTRFEPITNECNSWRKTRCILPTY